MVTDTDIALYIICDDYNMHAWDIFTRTYAKLSRFDWLMVM